MRVTALFAFAPVVALAQVQIGVDNPLRTGENQQAALRVNDAIYLAYGFGNTFLVTTSEGNVVIDTSSILRAPRAKELLQREKSGPIKYIILTHGHGDHTGGVPLWKGPDTQVIAQKQHYEFVNYQTRLAGFFAERNAAQFNFQRPQTGAWAGNYGAHIVATVQFDDRYEFTLGDTKFELHSSPGETPDHLTVWIPKYRAAFVGDNYYKSFPNIYTLRGTQPRWALDYVASLNEVLALKPELLLPSHGEPVRGNAEITRRLTQYRDAIQYVHDAVVRGMNDGKDVFTLMHEIKLPRELDVGEGYGNLIWSIRGIYEGYAGWYDMKPATLYDVPVDAVFADLAKLAGGAAPIAQLAAQYVDAGRYVEALHLTEVALASDPQFRPALEARLKALESLKAKSKNSNERGWLDYHIRVVKKKVSGP
ncbi:MAG TPA: MBL fold metallo-hydrolase [Steroidobacteraceae bacterium]|jgi:Alkyl sulfatase and related hydrolases|nr:MBL fold metallo-hydrolase [Steroidobacteraceae bacterium]